MSFGEKIKKLRKEKGWSQDELGKIVKMHGRYIGKYELDKVKPTSDAIIKLSKAFNVSTDYLLLDENKNNISSLNLKDSRLIKQFNEVDKMNDKDKETIISLIDAYIKKNQIENIIDKNK